MKLWEIKDKSHKDKYCYQRHAIAAVMQKNNFTIYEIAAAISRHRTTIYNCYEAHKSLLWTKDAGYLKVYNNVEKSRRFIMKYLKDNIGRDLDGVYSIDRAYAMGYEDGAKMVIDAIQAVVQDINKLESDDLLSGVKDILEMLDADIKEFL